MSRHGTSGGPSLAGAAEVLSELDTPQGRADPYPVYARLRDLAPVYCTAKGPAYLTRYDDCVAVIRDTSMRAQNAEWMDRVRPGWREHPGLRITTESFLFRDPPDHTRLRRLVSGTFTQRKAEELRDFVADLIGRVLDAVADAGGEGGAVDLHEILAAMLPIAVVGKVIGVPEADQPLLREPLEGLRLAVDGSPDDATVDVVDRAAEALLSYFADLVARRRRDPCDDLASALAALEDAGRNGADEGRQLTAGELLQTLILIFSAGIESMVDLLLNGVAALLAEPSQADLLRASPALAARAVEETLRYDAPVQAMGRITAADVMIGEVRVPAGRLVLLMLGAANRDPARFTAPDTFDLHRTGATPLSFGGGIHHCLGAPLGRLEAALFLPALLARFPALRPAGPPERRGLVLRGFARFPVTIR
jgi:cytochrome P450